MRRFHFFMHFFHFFASEFRLSSMENELLSMLRTEMYRNGLSYGEARNKLNKLEKEYTP